MNRGTKFGDLAEINFVKKFNSNKSSYIYSDYIKSCNINKLLDIYMVRVTTKQHSKLSNQKVMTRADVYLITSEDPLIDDILNKNEFYLDEKILVENKIKYTTIEYSGISIKMNDSEKFQILKLTPDSFNALFGEYEIGAGASVYCLKEEELFKNEDVFKGWKTTINKVIVKYEKSIPSLNFLNDEISISEKIETYKKLKSYSNKEIKRRIDESEKLQEIIFNGYGIYEEPYSATYFSKGDKIELLRYIPFTITTGSGRSKGIYTIVLKPKNETTN